MIQFRRSAITALFIAEVLVILTLYETAPRIPHLLRLFVVLEFLTIFAILQITRRYVGELSPDLQKRTSPVAALPPNLRKPVKLLALSLLSLLVVAFLNPAGRLIWIGAFALVAAAKVYVGEGLRKMEGKRR
jgi:hypothetical protein